MIKSFFVVAFLWLLVIMTIQAVRQAKGIQLVSWFKLIGLGTLGALITGVLLFFIVAIF